MVFDTISRTKIQSASSRRYPAEAREGGCPGRYWRSSGHLRDRWLERGHHAKWSVCQMGGLRFCYSDGRSFICRSLFFTKKECKRRSCDKPLVLHGRHHSPCDVFCYSFPHWSLPSTRMELGPTTSSEHIKPAHLQC